MELADANPLERLDHGIRLLTNVFSIVIPYHGRERYAESAFDSLWAQTFKEFEIIAVEDGSPDAADGTLEALAARSPRPMRVAHSVGQTESESLNAGAALAQARYVAFLNPNDRYDPDRLDVFARVLKSNERFTWGFSGVEPIDQNGSVMAVPAVRDSSLRASIYRSRTPIEVTRALTRENSVVSSGNLVVEAALFRDVGGFRDLRFTREWDLALRLLDHSDPYCVERKLYLYRVHDDQGLGEQSSRKSERMAAHEVQEILREHANRQARRSSFASSQVAPGGQVGYADPDNEWVIRIALWAVTKLRTIRPAYWLVRNAARFLRTLRRRWVER